MMKCILPGLCLAVLGLSPTNIAYAEPDMVGDYLPAFQTSDLAYKNNRVFGMKMVIPFGSSASRDDLNAQPRIGLFSGYETTRENLGRKSRAFGLGFTFSGQPYADYAGHSYSFNEAAHLFGLENAEGSDDGKGGKIALIVIGGVALTAAGVAIAEAQAEDAAKDIFECILGTDGQCREDE